jgi:hypothetical protein
VFAWVRLESLREVWYDLARQEAFAQGVARQFKRMPTNATATPRRSWSGEKLLTLRDLSRELCRTSDAPIQRSHWTLRRWIIEGCAVNGSKKRIKLPHTILFGERHSSVEAVREFIYAIAGDSE